MDARVKPSEMPPLARLRAALAGAHYRLQRRPGRAQEPLWTPMLTRWLVAALVVALLAGLADDTEGLPGPAPKPGELNWRWNS